MSVIRPIVAGLAFGAMIGFSLEAIGQHGWIVFGVTIGGSLVGMIGSAWLFDHVESPTKGR
jgi:hypothetical protein